MIEIKIYEDNGKTKARIYEDNHFVKELKEKEIYKVLDAFKENKRNLRKRHIKGNNLYFTISNVTILLKDYNKFKNDEKFNFIFLNNKTNYKLKKKIITGIIIASITTLIAMPTANAMENYQIEENASEIQQTYIDDKIQEEKEIEFEKQTTKINDIKSYDDTKIKIEEDQNKNNDEYYSDRFETGSLYNSDKACYVRDNYGDIIEKYCNLYGLDFDLMCAIATQESGKHYTTISSNGGFGLFQIQRSVHINTTLRAHNEQTGKEDSITVTDNGLADLDTNIRYGCMIYKGYYDQFKHNKMAALVAYNAGNGTVWCLLNEYANKTGKSVDEILNSDDIGWLDCRNTYSKMVGDFEYPEHVLRYYSNDNVNTKVNA